MDCNIICMIRTFPHVVQYTASINIALRLALRIRVSPITGIQMYCTFRLPDVANTTHHSGDFMSSLFWLGPLSTDTTNRRAKSAEVLGYRAWSRLGHGGVTGHGVRFRWPCDLAPRTPLPFEFPTILHRSISICIYLYLPATARRHVQRPSTLLDTDCERMYGPVGPIATCVAPTVINTAFAGAWDSCWNLHDLPTEQSTCMLCTVVG